MEIKISIICPVYNAAKYLHKCIDSIIAQTLPEWELILVNDGSTDNSGIICDRYASEDLRIKVYHKHNSGVSAARQTGILNAHGEYSIHVDSDDWIEPNMLEELYYNAVSERADMVICNMFKDDKNGAKVIKETPTDINNNDVIIRDLLCDKLHGSNCNKLVRHSIYNEFGIKYPTNINYCEDLLICLSMLVHPIKVIYINKAYYHYVVTDTSITHTGYHYENRKKFTLQAEKILPVYLKDDLRSRAYRNKLYAYLKGLIDYQEFKSFVPVPISISLNPKNSHNIVYFVSSVLIACHLNKIVEFYTRALLKLRNGK